MHDPIRFRNDSCLICGGADVADVTVERREDYYHYHCPKCGNTIANEVRSTRGNPAEVPTHVHTPPSEATVGDDISWDTWAQWWTNRATCVRIHGKVVEGDEELEPLIERCLSLTTNG
jgi:predicted RNA-binding Zn-ribbon protein involved in translation (DUF1610 family)